MAGGFRGLTGWLTGSAFTRAPDLGPRELDVLDRLWSGEHLTSAEIAARLGPESVTLSTVQSTLERLHRKGIVARDKAGRAFRYRVLLTRSQLIGLMLRDLAEDLGDGDPALLISGFVEFAAGDDPAIRKELTRLLASDSDGERTGDD